MNRSKISDAVAQTLIDFWFDLPWRNGGAEPGYAGEVSSILGHARRQG